MATTLLMVFGVAAVAPAGAAQENVRERLARAELLAGLTPVSGPGLVVILRDSPRKPPRGADKKSFQIHDQDVTAVLNALRAAGAEALAIGSGNGGVTERVLASTAVTSQEDDLRVNGSRLRPPYRILAIGDRDALRTELFRPTGVVKRAGLDTLQMVEALESERLDLPAARNVGAFRYARVTGEAAPAPELFVTQPKAALPSPRPQPASHEQPPTTVPNRPLTDPRTPGEYRASRDAGSRPAAGGPAPAAPSAPATGRLFGGKGLARFHAAGCRFGERIEAGQRVTFGSLDEAKSAGRAPCPICKPGSN